MLAASLGVAREMAGEAQRRRKCRHIHWFAGGQYGNRRNGGENQRQSERKSENVGVWAKEVEIVGMDAAAHIYVGQDRGDGDSVRITTLYCLLGNTRTPPIRRLELLRGYALIPWLVS